MCLARCLRPEGRSIVRGRNAKLERRRRSTTPVDVPDIPDTMVGITPTHVFELVDPDPRLSAAIDEVTALYEDGKLRAVQELATEEPVAPAGVLVGEEAHDQARTIKLLMREAGTTMKNAKTLQDSLSNTIDEAEPHVNGG